jgi:hypothetical protein
LRGGNIRPGHLLSQILPPRKDYGSEHRHGKDHRYDEKGQEDRDLIDAADEHFDSDEGKDHSQAELQELESVDHAGKNEIK